MAEGADGDKAHPGPSANEVFAAEADEAFRALTASPVEKQIGKDDSFMVSATDERNTRANTSDDDSFGFGDCDMQSNRVSAALMEPADGATAGEAGHGSCQQKEDDDTAEEEDEDAESADQVAEGQGRAMAYAMKRPRMVVVYSSHSAREGRSRLVTRLLGELPEVFSCPDAG